MPTRGRLNERLLMLHGALTGCRSESTPFCSLSSVQSRVSVNNEIEDRVKWNTGQVELKWYGTDALKKNCLSCVPGDQEELHTEGDSWSLGKISRDTQSRNGILGWENHRSGDNAFLQARSIVFCFSLKQKFHAQEFALYSLHGGESNADCAR